MLGSHKLFVAWRRQVFVRNPHPDLNALFAGMRGRGGIYLIGCADEIVYVGQSVNLTERPLDSLGRIYHRVPDVSLPWWLALAPCPREEWNERESTAIRTYAPRFNTSIPSIPSSQGRMPEIVGYAAVFQNQATTGGAFAKENLHHQIARAAADPSPPWRQGKQRPKTGPRGPRPVPMTFDPPVPLQGEELGEARRRFGVPAQAPLTYPVNLCDDGSVVTRDGEVIGTWGADQYECCTFTPYGQDTPLFKAPLVGLLCMSIREWHETTTGEKL